MTDLAHIFRHTDGALVFNYQQFLFEYYLYILAKSVEFLQKLFNFLSPVTDSGVESVVEHQQATISKLPTVPRILILG